MSEVWAMLDRRSKESPPTYTTLMGSTAADGTPNRLRVLTIRRSDGVCLSQRDATDAEIAEAQAEGERVKAAYEAYRAQQIAAGQDPAPFWFYAMTNRGN